MTAEHREHSASQPIPSLDELVSMAKKRFDSTETFDPTTPDNPKHGKIQEGYTSYLAGQDIVDDLVGQGIGATVLAGYLMQETKVSINEVEWEFVFGWDQKRRIHKDWDKAMHNLAGQLIQLELLRRHPEIQTEEDRRQYLH